MKALFFLVIFCTGLYGEIREIRSISEMEGHLEGATLIVFDIDNTIMEPVQTLGSDQWFYHRKELYLERGYPSQEALEMALAEWMSVQNLTRVQLVEKETQKLISTLQKEKRAVMGLTTRGLGLATRTLEQLQSLHVDLSKTAPVQKEILIMSERGVLYRQGILFTAGTHKGKAFLQLLKEKGTLPKKVIFINDKETHLKEVEESCKASKIAFLGLRYSFLDEKVKNFSPTIASIQWEYFGKLLSDEVALKVQGGVH